jgi:hypothetical protein
MYHIKKELLSITLAAFLCLGSFLLQAKAETPQSKRDDAETLRKALHEFLPMLKTCASCGNEDNTDQIAKLEQKLDGLSKEELAAVTRAFDVPRFTDLVEKLKARIATSEEAGMALAPLKSPLEPPNYENGCSPPRRPSAMTLLSLLLVISVMEEAENASAIICETGASIPLEGIGTPACIASLFVESVAILTRFTVAAFLNCIASIDSAEIEASWKNSVNIHSDITTSGKMTDQRLNTIEQKLNSIGVQLQKVLDNSATTTTPQGKKDQGVSSRD